MTEALIHALAYRLAKNRPETLDELLADVKVGTL